MKHLILIFLICATSCALTAQTSLVVKANAGVLGYYPAAAGFGTGIGLEVNAGKKLTLSVNTAFGNVQDLTDVKYSITPEVRYYFKSAFNGFYVGVNGTYDKFKPKNDLDDKFGTYLFGVGANTGYNIVFKNNITAGLGIGANLMGPSRNDNSVNTKLVARLEVGYKF